MTRVQRKSKPRITIQFFCNGAKEEGIRDCIINQDEVVQRKYKNGNKIRDI